MMLTMRLSLLLLVFPTTATALAAKFPSPMEGMQRFFLNNVKEHRQGGLSEAAPFRSLQTTAPGDDAFAESVCNANGTFTISYDDDFPGTTDNGAVCNCTEEDNSEAVFYNITVASALLKAFSDNITIISLNQSDVDAIVDGINTAFGSISAASEYDCVDTCATCFDELSICGIFETTEKNYKMGKPANLTLEEIQGLMFEAVDAVYSFFSRTCITYSKGEIGKLCLTSNASGSISSGSSFECSVEYNNVMCKTCSIQISTTDDTAGCVTADCTNINPNATLDSCAGTGFVGPFALAEIILSTNDTISTTAVCDAPPPTNSSGGDSPITAPAPVAPQTVTDTPTAPVASPTVADTPTAPEAPPTVADSPTAPVAPATVADTPTAPVAPPTVADTPAAPKASTTVADTPAAPVAPPTVPKAPGASPISGAAAAMQTGVTHKVILLIALAVIASLV